MDNHLKLGYYFFKNFLCGVKFPIGIAIDVINQCNLRCKHCYFWQQPKQRELPKDEFLKKLRELKNKNPSLIHASWVGGEPLLRKDFLAEGTKLFPFNMIVTNGTIPLPSWRNCVFNVSIDGTKKDHEAIRGLHTYDQIKDNIADREDIKINIACILNRNNYHCIQDMLEEWSETKVGGINFGFYTPIQGIREDLWLNWQERDSVVNQLLELRKQHGNFLLNPECLLESMLSKNAKAITDHCLLPKSTICLDAAGKRKLPCVIGRKADCSRCGCVIPFLQEIAFKKRNLGISFLLK